MTCPGSQSPPSSSSAAVMDPPGAVLDPPEEETHPLDRLTEMNTWLLHQPVVLVVDDDDDARDTLATLLERDGIAVVQACDGEAALRLAASGRVSAVVLDVMLPDLTGFDVCRALRDDPATRRIPIVMLTALTGLTDEVTGVLSGADAYLVKPARTQQLLARLHELI